MTLGRVRPTWEKHFLYNQGLWWETETLDLIVLRAKLKVLYRKKVRNVFEGIYKGT